MKLQRLSEYFGVSKSVFKQKGIFDAIIGVDSGFYLDPTLLKNTRIPEFKGAYKQIENHYENAFSMLKLAKGNRNSKPWKVAVQECTFAVAFVTCQNERFSKFIPTIEAITNTFFQKGTNIGIITSKV